MTWNPELTADTTDELTYIDEAKLQAGGEKRLTDDGIQFVELSKDELTKTGEDALELWHRDHDTCNGFAFAYLDENPNAIVKVELVNGDHHCYVYDPTLGDDGAVIDATLGQFDGCPTVGMWDGETHPYTDENQKPADEYTNEEQFKNDFDGDFSPFYL
jgi:hypothetical protein